MTSADRRITMSHGSGGRQTHDLVQDLLLSRLGNKTLNRMEDSAVISPSPGSRIAMTTDSYVVQPLFFPGGDIGRLSVCGTVNDLATSGAVPQVLSLGLILEEGLEFDTLEEIVDSIARAAQEAGVLIATGDTKVINRGPGDGLYINTAGIGFIEDGIEISSHNGKPGDKVILTGPLGNHEIALMKARGLIPFETDIQSDVAPLNRYVKEVLDRGGNISAIKDPTRGGLASALHEICGHSGCNVTIYEEQIPVDRNVKAVCELAGFDPLYLANEGKYVILCKPESSSLVLDIFGSAGAVIGEVQERSDGKGELLMETRSGGLRRLGMLETTQLPRIC